MEWKVSYHIFIFPLFLFSYSELVAVFIIPQQSHTAPPSAPPPLTHRPHIMGLVSTPWSVLHIVYLTHLAVLPHQSRAPPDHRAVPGGGHLVMVSTWSLIHNVYITHQIQLLPVPGHVPNTAAVTIEHSLLTHNPSSDVTRCHQMLRGVILSHLFPSEHVINHHSALGAPRINKLLTSVGHGGEVTPEGGFLVACNIIYPRSNLMRVCSTLWPVYVITLRSPVTWDLM